MECQGKSILLLLLFLGVNAFIVPDYSKEKGLPKSDVFTFPPINPDASPETAELLYFLYHLKGKYTLAGQHNFLEAPNLYSNKLKEEIGHSPVLHGYEMGAIMNQNRQEIKKLRQKVVDSAIVHHEQGGIVAMTYHAHLPGECACWEQVNNGGISAADFKNIITHGTDMNKKLLADLDDVAFHLKQLKEFGVPVLWRPFHEMNGDWFWWGKQDEYSELWEIMYERFTKVHKLNNLLWVWSPAAPNKYAEPFQPYYVGPLRADVLAVDIYHNEYEQSHHDQLWVLSGGKPIAIGENGDVPSSELLNVDQKQYVWFMTWGNELVEQNDISVVAQLYSDDKVLTMEKKQAMLNKAATLE